MENESSHLILSWLVSGLAVFVTAWIVPGFRISGYFAAVLAALGIGLVNALLWPLLFFLTLPINLLTLGLFTFVVNGAILKIAAFFLPGFELSSWWSAIFGSIVLSLVSVFLHWALF
ncbi:MAG: phage holin family protein [Bdellovibrionaceae bacterium]|nr:phage holin family protein [Pseudobdellovibrionaceae bacterium]MBX3033871.1 phage holin family protein [Pseudobdellovibrionaceae bacterium]